MNQKQLLLLGERKLKQNKIEDAHIKAKKLLEHVLNQNTTELVINALSEVLEEKQLYYEQKLQQIIEGKPLQYITNQQEFMGLNFYVDENVLIPQPDTEILVENTIKLIQSQSTTKEKIHVLDLCTGSGCIGISLARYIKNINVTVSDISQEAINIAKRNATNSKVKDKMKFICSDLFKKIVGNQFDYIVSNPPYIETNTIPTLSLEVRQEPYIALNGGEDGLDFYKKILEQAPNYLNENGYLLLEIGFNQGKKITELWTNSKNTELNLITTQPIKDLSTNDRVLIFQKK